MTRIKKIHLNKYIWTHYKNERRWCRTHNRARLQNKCALEKNTQILCYIISIFAAKFANLNSLLNRPFYICVLSTLAFDWMWGWRWLCFSINLCFIKGFVYRFSQLSLGYWFRRFDRVLQFFENFIYCCSFCHWCEEIWAHHLCASRTSLVTSPLSNCF